MQIDRLAYIVQGSISELDPAINGNEEDYDLGEDHGVHCGLCEAKLDSVGKRIYSNGNHYHPLCAMLVSMAVRINSEIHQSTKSYDGMYLKQKIQEIQMDVSTVNGRMNNFDVSVESARQEAADAIAETREVKGLFQKLLDKANSAKTGLLEMLAHWNT